MAVILLNLKLIFFPIISHSLTDREPPVEQVTSDDSYPHQGGDSEVIDCTNESNEFFFLFERLTSLILWAYKEHQLAGSIKRKTSPLTTFREEISWWSQSPHPAKNLTFLTLDHGRCAKELAVLSGIHIFFIPWGKLRFLRMGHFEINIFVSVIDVIFFLVKRIWEM